MNTALGLLLVNAKNRPQRDGVSYIKNDVLISLLFTVSTEAYIAAAAASSHPRFGLCSQAAPGQDGPFPGPSRRRFFRQYARLIR